MRVPAPGGTSNAILPTIFSLGPIFAGTRCAGTRQLVLSILPFTVVPSSHTSIPHDSSAKSEGERGHHHHRGKRGILGSRIPLDLVKVFSFTGLMSVRLYASTDLPNHAAGTRL